MFEKNRPFSSAAEDRRMPVRLTLADGSQLAGTLALGASARLADAVNGAGGFLELLRTDGTVTFLNRQTVSSLEPVTVPRADALALKAGDFDPWRTLGIARDATLEQAHAGYITQARRYHPDRIRPLDLPREVVSHIEAMSARINAAWDMVSAELAPPPVSDPLARTMA